MRDRVSQQTKICNDLDVFENNNEELYLLMPKEDEVCELEFPDPIISLEEDIDRQKTHLKLVKRENKRARRFNTDTQIADLLNEDFSTTRRSSGNVEERINSALSSLIEQKIQTKALPLALRKRLMYQRAAAS